MEATLNEILKRINTLASKMDEINTKVDAVWRFNQLDIYFGDSTYSQFLEHRSPIKLAPEGIEFLKFYGADICIDSNLDVLLKEFQNGNYKSPLDIQEASKAIIAKSFKLDIFIPVRDKLYQEPAFNKKLVPIHALIQAMGFYLRDKYFEKNPKLIAP